jgi:hypothetical protein
MSAKGPSYDLRLCSLEDVRDLCVRFHGYGSAGGVCVYAFAVYEEGRVVAAYAWQPPPPGAAKSVCPESPQGVLALSRMVAVPREERLLRHVSKPLRRQMLREIDRTRWPVLVTYSDEGQGHTGHVYKCSGWTPTAKAKRTFYLAPDGTRASAYSNGKMRGTKLQCGGRTTIQRWEHWICPVGTADAHMLQHGWKRQPVPGKVWRSGNTAFEYVRVAT